mmetsp:Transcript_24878/g.64059  ORF Transcript_24878/g.64059 Transcript_24878/m.64059 type:complete len:303 (+) Transcript_24878:286-1194(+)
MTGAKHNAGSQPPNLQYMPVPGRPGADNVPRGSIGGDARTFRFTAATDLEDVRNQLDLYDNRGSLRSHHTPGLVMLDLIQHSGRLAELFQQPGFSETAAQGTGISEAGRAELGGLIADCCLASVRMAGACAIDLGAAIKDRLQPGLSRPVQRPSVWERYGGNPAVQERVQTVSFVKPTAADGSRRRAEGDGRGKPALAEGKGKPMAEDGKGTAPVPEGRERPAAKEGRDVPAADDGTGSMPGKRKRFTDAQVKALSELAEKSNWSMTSIPLEERDAFCTTHDITKDRMHNFFNNRKPKAARI